MISQSLLKDLMMCPDSQSALGKDATCRCSETLSGIVEGLLHSQQGTLD